MFLLAIILRELFIYAEELVCFPLSLTIRTRKLGIISLFALVDRKLKWTLNLIIADTFVCVVRLRYSLLPQASVSVYIYLSFVSCLKVGEISVLP